MNPAPTADTKLPIKLGTATAKSIAPDIVDLARTCVCWAACDIYKATYSFLGQAASCQSELLSKKCTEARECTTMHAGQNGCRAIL